MHEGDERREFLGFLFDNTGVKEWKFGHTSLRQVPENRGLRNIEQKSAHLPGDATAHRDDVNSDKPSNDGPIALWNAYFYGHEGVVKLLFARNDINPDRPTNDGQAPLRAAFYNKHEVVVKLLLAQNNVYLNKRDNHG